MICDHEIGLRLRGSLYVLMFLLQVHFKVPRGCFALKEYEVIGKLKIYIFKHSD